MADNSLQDAKNLSGCLKGCGVIVVISVAIGVWVALTHGSDKRPHPACLSVPADVVALITAGLKPGYGPLRAVQAVSEQDFPSGYTVAAAIEQASGDSQIGAWQVTGGISNAREVAKIRSFKGYAHTFSTFEDIGFVGTIDSFGYDDAIDCVKQRT